MIRVLIVDDEPEIGRILKKMVEREEGFAVVGVCTAFSEALGVFTEEKPELVFMDIDLGGESGLTCAKIMTELDPRVRIIFATAHSEFMAGAFELYAFDYLVKPFNMERVSRTLSRLRELDRPDRPAAAPVRAELEASKSAGEKLLIRNKDQVFFVEKSAILLIERQGGTTVITTQDGTYQSTASLTSLEKVLDGRVFFRCHKSFIINLRALVSAEVYGRWTYSVRLKGTDRTALMTAQKYEELKERL